MVDSTGQIATGMTLLWPTPSRQHTLPSAKQCGAAAGSVRRLEQRLLADNIAHGHVPSRDRSSRVIYRDISYEEREGESSSAHRGLRCASHGGYPEERKPFQRWLPQRRKQADDCA
jgi:hypothetical protein